MDIIQVVGYKNSGKTTLAAGMIRFFSGEGRRTAALKHHGHGGAPDAQLLTDSAKLTEAGAILSGVEGAGVLQLTIVQPDWSIDQLLSFYRLLPVDLLIIEGYKALDFPKIVLLRSPEDLPLLDNLSNIAAVAASFALDAAIPYPVLQPDAEQICGWLSQHVLGRAGPYGF